MGQKVDTVARGPGVRRPGSPLVLLWDSGSLLAELSTSVRWGETPPYWAVHVSLRKPLVGSKA